MKSIRPLVCALFAGAAIAMAAPAAAAFPDKPVHIVIPYTAGAGTDVMFRQVVPYSAERSFVPISRVVTTQMLMVSHVNTPFKTLPEILRQRVPTPFVVVPYKGMSGAMADLVGGSVDITPLDAGSWWGMFAPTPDTSPAYVAQLQRETEIWKQVVPSISSR